MATIGTYNEEGLNVDLYIPRKCHATNNLIGSFDHSAIQLTIANVDANGVVDGTTTTLCITGYLRAQGESDHAINHLAIGKGMMRIKTGKKPRAKKGKAGKGAMARGAARGAQQQQQKGGRPVPGKRNAPAGQRGPQQKGPQRGGARQQDQKQKQGGKPRGEKAAPQGRSKQAAPTGRRTRPN